MLTEVLQKRRVRKNVGLIGHYDLGPRGKLRAVLAQFCVDGVEVCHRVPALAAGGVHNMDQKTAAVDMAEEVVAQARSVGGALNNAGDIGHDEGDALLHIDYAQVGEESGEVVVGDLGPGLADHT